MTRRQQVFFYRLLLTLMGIGLLVTVIIMIYPAKDSDTASPAETTTPVTVQAANAPAATAAPNADSRVIIIDPGHGGGSGCICAGVVEDEINLAIAKKLQTLLTQRGYTIYMTREDSGLGDSVKLRAEFANQKKADLYISIHQNSEGETEHGSITGIETYYSDNKKQSAAFADALQTAVVKSTGANDRNTRIENEYVVVRLTKMPSVIVECGFLTNPEEREKLQTAAYQQKIADGLAQGVDNYFAQL